MDIIELKDLSFSYDHFSDYILNDINISILSGDYVSIIGKNGSAKSTLLKLILKLLKPCKGTVRVNTNRIGYVPQRVESFNAQFPITVYEILKCHMKAMKIKDTNKIKEVMKVTGIDNFNNKLIGNLSGGQQQKVFIARALIGNPELLILDEPSTGVDEKSQDEIYSIIKSLNMDKKITVLSVEHNIKTALKYSSHILKLDDANANLLTVNDFINAKEEENDASL